MKSMDGFVRGRIVTRARSAAELAFVFALMLIASSCATTSKKKPEYAAPVPQSCNQFVSEIHSCAAKSRHKGLSGLLSRIARCETGNKCTGEIDSPNGLYHGPFQYAEGTWKAVCKPMFERKHLSSCLKSNAFYDTCCATMCAAEMIAAGGLHNWPVCGPKSKHAFLDDGAEMSSFAVSSTSSCR